MRIRQRWAFTILKLNEYVALSNMYNALFGPHLHCSYLLLEARSHLYYHFMKLYYLELSMLYFGVLTVGKDSFTHVTHSFILELHRPLNY